MKIDRGLVLALGAAALTSACASGGASGPSVSVPPPDVVCSTGMLTAFPVADSAAATLALMATVAEEARPAEYAGALEQSRRAIAAQPDNAYGYFLGAQAALGVEDFAEAERMIAGAVERCPELDAEVSDYRAIGANQAFERAGSLLTAAGDTAGAIAAYEASLRLYPENYPADFYLGLIAFQRQQTDDAVRHWRQVMEVIDALPAADDAETTADRASARANAQNAMIFAARQYLEREQVDPAIALLTEIRRAAPNNSEAAYYHALALNTQQRWAELLPVARQATELAPLSYGAWILYYNAFAGQSQAATQAGNPTQGIELARQARDVSERSENLPVQIEGVSVDLGDAGTTVRGTAVGTGETAPVRLEFTLHGPAGTAGTGIVTVTPPAADAQSPFEVVVDTTGPVTGVSYRVLGS
jgi:tetratricopeptide (TPR) repeat protein